MASLSLNGLKPGTAYSVQVQAEGATAADVSDWSLSYTFVTPGSPQGTVSTSNSMKIGGGSVIYTGNPPPQSLTTNTTNPTGNSAMVIKNDTFTVINPDGVTNLFKLDVNNNSIYINAANFIFDSTGIGGTTDIFRLGTSGHNLTMNSSGDVSISGTFSASAINVGTDYWNSTGFLLGGSGGISYTYASDAVVIGNSGSGITVSNTGIITMGSDVSISGNLITSGTINASNFETSSSSNYPRVSLTTYSPSGTFPGNPLSPLSPASGGILITDNISGTLRYGGINTNGNGNLYITAQGSGASQIRIAGPYSSTPNSLQ